MRVPPKPVDLLAALCAVLPKRRLLEADDGRRRLDFAGWFLAKLAGLANPPPVPLAESLGLASPSSGRLLLDRGREPLAPKLGTAVVVWRRLRSGGGV